MKEEDTDKLIETEIIDRVLLDILEELPEEALTEFNALSTDLKKSEDDEISNLNNLKSFLEIYNIDLDQIMRRNRDAVISEIESV